MYQWATESECSGEERKKALIDLPEIKTQTAKHFNWMNNQYLTV